MESGQTGEVTMVMKILFVCTGNLERSPTAEAMFKGRDDLEVKSTGQSKLAQTLLLTLAEC